MILSLHAAAGAALAANSNTIGQVIILGLASHYLLDSLPHVEYGIENLKKGDLKMLSKEFFNIFIDVLASLAIALYVIQNKGFDRSILILIGTFSALLPDGFYLIDCLIENKDKNIFTKFLRALTIFHQKIHSSVKNKLITISSQIIIFLILIFGIFLNN